MVDIPLDLQWAEIKNCEYNIKKAKLFKFDLLKINNEKKPKKDFNPLIIDALKSLKNAQKPLVIIGAGCKQNNVGEELVKLFTELSIPMVLHGVALIY